MKVPKRVLYAAVEEARACGMGPAHLGRLLGYSWSHMSKIAIELGLESWRCGQHETVTSVRWSERLLELIQAAMRHSCPPGAVARCANCGTIVSGIVRPQETQAA